ncbi:hypothetical protein GGR28_002628 [Lewinella aquimaris]|uniref:DinB-like domain-containing protein n=1 Tax=Neolewinella aquimaris TaxID=1835722 RepID=A0A840E499_9BACT|nr:putative metal-dependent hydrolase [Neolewinella aquimaris]MBB4080001.1 hypothetical protein [Neolewinella aquimaris]
MNDTDPLRYPIGTFTVPETGDETLRLQSIKRIGSLPERLEVLADELRSRKLLDTPYRPGGWTAQQVIHHLADSHLHAYRRHKVTLVEDHPTLVPYNEGSWAELPDVAAVPVQASLDILRGLHLRWAVLLAQCTDRQWRRTAFHPGSGITYHLDTLAAHYAWHGDHHLGHLRIVLENK